MIGVLAVAVVYWVIKGTDEKIVEENVAVGERTAA